MTHRDPTFDAVAKRQARDCTTCHRYAALWGLIYCEAKRWAGFKNMRRCDQFKRKEPNEPSRA